MEWLAYTVTFKSHALNDDFHIIKYNKWENFNGLVLPKEITWYESGAKGMPTIPAGEPVEFTLPLVSQGKLVNSFLRN